MEPRPKPDMISRALLSARHPLLAAGSPGAAGHPGGGGPRPSPMLHAGVGRLAQRDDIDTLYKITTYVGCDLPDRRGDAALVAGSLPRPARRPRCGPDPRQHPARAGLDPRRGSDLVVLTVVTFSISPTSRTPRRPAQRPARLTGHSPRSTNPAHPEAAAPLRIKVYGQQYCGATTTRDNYLFAYEERWCRWTPPWCWRSRPT